MFTKGEVEIVFVEMYKALADLVGQKRKGDVDGSEVLVKDMEGNMVYHLDHRNRVEYRAKNFQELALVYGQMVKDLVGCEFYFVRRAPEFRIYSGNPDCEGADTYEDFSMVVFIKPPEEVKYEVAGVFSF